MSMGWIKLHRSLRDHPRYQDSAWVHLWLELLLRATHQLQAAIFRGRRIELVPGQLITGRKSLARCTGLSESKVQRVLKTMQVEGEIEQETTNQNRLITIRNWGTYQDRNFKSDPQAHTDGTTGAQQADTYKNGENENNAEDPLGVGVPPDGIHRRLVGCPQLHGMTYEQDLAVRQGFKTAPVSLDWHAVADYAVGEAELMTEPIHNPALFWRKRIQRYVDTQVGTGVENGGSGGAGDRLRQILTK